MIDNFIIDLVVTENCNLKCKYCYETQRNINMTEGQTIVDISDIWTDTSYKLTCYINRLYQLAAVLWQKILQEEKIIGFSANKINHVQSRSIERMIQQGSWKKSFLPL